VDASKVLSWSENAALPLLPSAKALSLFTKLRGQPSLSTHRINGDALVPYNELHSTKNKKLFTPIEGPAPGGSIKIYKGESFDTWEPDRGVYHGIARDNLELLLHLQKARESSFGRKGSAFNMFTKEYVANEGTLAIHGPRIAFRDISRATDTRSIRACLIPPSVSIADNPVVIMKTNSEKAEAFYLGMLCSRTTDWYARRFVELHFKIYHFNTLPVPHFSDSVLSVVLINAAGRLACPDRRFAQWAKAVGVECGPLKPEEKQELIDRLDATAALLYGLSEQELETVFETFHEGWDWKHDHARVLAEYRRLKAKHSL
jgi:hypothetical protein